MKRRAIAVLALALAACTAPEKSRVSEAATTPLSDLNLVHATIPAALADAQKGPYVTPVDPRCRARPAGVGGGRLAEAGGRQRGSPAAIAGGRRGGGSHGGRGWAGGCCCA